MKKSDLYKKWGCVLEMCEGTRVNPCSAWKFNGYVQNDKLPNFEYDKPECFEFLVAILEDKPVFVGDKIYSIQSRSWITVQPEDAFADIKGYSWEEPKKTLTLNGEELPCPDDSNKFELVIRGFAKHTYHFYEKNDICKVEAAINKLLQDATK